MDRRLVALARAGDAEAFERLAIAIGGRMHAVAYSILRDAGLAEDATQQALLEAWRGLSGLRDPDRFEAWIFRLLVRACHAEVRGIRRWVPNLVSRPPDVRSEGDAQSAVADREQLERGFERLSFDQRAVVVLHYYLDMPASDIADVLDIAPGTARSRLYNATLSLRAALDADALYADPTHHRAGGDTMTQHPDDLVRTMRPLLRAWLEEGVQLLPGGSELPTAVRDRIHGELAQAHEPGSILTGRVQLRFGAISLGVAAIGVTLLTAFMLVVANLDADDTVLPGAADAVLPPVTGPAGNGLIVFDRDGDIYVGDPETGTERAIVSGPEWDSAPAFSPDGSRVAFSRGERFEPSSIVVVASDGSDEVVVAPEGSPEGAGLFAWSPDGTTLVVNHNGERHLGVFGGALSMIDASGMGPARDMTPPLPYWPGAPWFNEFLDVAPMLRPPDGDLILSGDDDSLDVFDRDLWYVRQLGGAALEEYEHYFVGWPTWSPDGSMILFWLDDMKSGTGGMFVMEAESGEARRVGDGHFGTWSPDGSRIASMRHLGTLPDPDAVIVISDVVSGEERVLDETAVVRKSEHIVWVDSSGDEQDRTRDWDYEGWSWSPDGSSIVMLEQHGTRPLLIDVETGEATVLPWVADSAPSWQRVALP